MRRVAAVGLDSADWDLVEALMGEGRLPNLARLRRRAATAALHHADYRINPIWEHFLTGRGPAGTGRWSVLGFDPADYSVVQEGARTLVPFFAPVADRTVCLDVPYLSPASAGDATTVIAWGAHDPGHPPASSPPELLGELERRFGPHPARDCQYDIVWHRPDALDRFADALEAGARRRAEVATWMLAQVDWSLFVTVFSETHSAAEQLWHGVDADHPVNQVVDPSAARTRLAQVYGAVDEAIGELLADLPAETTVVVFSMHGAAPNEVDVASMVLLPELLHRLAFERPLLREPDRAGWVERGRPPLLPPPDVSWQDVMADHLPGEDRPRRAPRRLLRSSHRGAARIRRAAPPASGRSGGRPTEPIGWHPATRYRRWWPEMPAFALPSFSDGQVRLNLVGRERRGVVSPGDYDKVCRLVEDALRECTDTRTGAPVVDDVLRLRDDDPWSVEGPDADLEVRWHHPVDAVDHPSLGAFGPYPFRRTGSHRSGGFALVAGPGISAGHLGTHDALAVTATLASLTGAEVSGLEAPPLPIAGGR